jgi:hypothetical protein
VNALGLPLTGVVAALVLWPGLEAAAANRKTDVPDPWMTDRYEIEIIVFRHRDQSRNTSEQLAPGEFGYPSLGIYPPSNSAPTAPHIGPYSDTAAQELGGDPRRIEPTISFLLDLQPRFPDSVPLAEDRLQLGRVFERLRTLDAYAPLVHKAWLQAAQPADATQPLQIDSDASGEYAVTGTIRFYKERYTHLEIDLDLRQTEPDADGAQSGPGNWPVFGDVFAAPEPEPVPLRSADGPTFKLQESRRIRGSNAQYFDHPQFGVIARIIEVQLESD